MGAPKFKREAQSEYGKIRAGFIVRIASKEKELGEC